MRKILIAVLTLFTIAGVCSAAEQQDEAQGKKLVSTMDKVSYGIGMSLGRDFAAGEVAINADVLAQGIKDTLAGKTLLTEDEARATLMAFQQEMRVKQEAKGRELAEKNKRAGDAFLAENGKKEGVMTLPSGLQYKILTVGKGNKPTKSDTVSVHYRGTLVDGTEFDSSYKRGEPATFPVSGVIPGWTEALQLMPEGSKWQLYIPADLAYGERGAGPVIAPNSTLIFEVELLSIK